MVLILDNSSADIAIVMPKPDLTKDQFSYSNLYSFDYDGAAAGVNGASVESSTSSMSGHAGSDDDSVRTVLQEDLDAFTYYCALFLTA